MDPFKAILTFFYLHPCIWGRGEKRHHCSLAAWAIVALGNQKKLFRSSPCAHYFSCQGSFVTTRVQLKLRTAKENRVPLAKHTAWEGRSR